MHVVVIVAVRSDLNEMFNHCCPGGRRVSCEDLGADPGGHLEVDSRAMMKLTHMWGLNLAKKP